MIVQKLSEGRVHRQIIHQEQGEVKKRLDKLLTTRLCIPKADVGPSLERLNKCSQQIQGLFQVPSVEIKPSEQNESRALPKI